MKREYLKVGAFTSRLSEYLLNAYYIDLLCKQGNLDVELLKVRMRDLEDEFSSKSFNALFSENDSESEKMKVKIKEKRESRNRKQVDNLLPILLNQSLVMLCAVFDTFLNDSFSVIINTKPLILKKLTSKKLLTASEIINLRDYQKIIKDLQRKALKQFEIVNIAEKFDHFEKLGLSRKLVFKFDNHMDSKYPKARSFLLDIYKKRSDVVHRNILVLKNFEELSYIAEFMEYLIYKICKDISKQLGILCDYHLIYNKIIPIEEMELE